MIKYTFICSDKKHPAWEKLSEWISSHRLQKEMKLIASTKEIDWTGEILFLISCSEIIQDKTRKCFSDTIVFHASDLPKGRGWSPHIWEIVKGADHFTLSMIDAAPLVDSGHIWAKSHCEIPKAALFDEINEILFTAMFGMIENVVEDRNSFVKFPQDMSVAPTYYEKRQPKDSEIDPNKSITEQFDILRVSDPNRFPSYFRFRGKKFNITISRCEE